MNTEHLHFTFGAFQSSAHLTPELPDIEQIARDFGENFCKPLLICDGNTEYLAAEIGGSIPRCTLQPGEQHKNWQAVEAILRCARDAGLGRDGVFIGVGGGVVGDLAAFAASIYMRGCSLALVPTTLLSMVDAALGGKTGFDLWGIKNLAGTFFPARHVYLSAKSLTTLPPYEWKSGMAELIKTAILDGDDFLEDIAQSHLCASDPQTLIPCISRAARFKGSIVQEDPLEKGEKRVLLNLGHTFGHALESAAGLGTISHGEAVAWGIARACDLGLELGICPAQRAQRIRALLDACGYETAAPHPLTGKNGAFMEALGNDKKKRSGKLCFIVPDAEGARPVQLELSFVMDKISRIAGISA